MIKSALIEFDGEPAYNERFLKTKIKSHGSEVTDFYNKKIPKADCIHTCLAIISLDSPLNKHEKLLSTIVFKRV